MTWWVFETLIASVFFGKEGSIIIHELINLDEVFEGFDDEDTATIDDDGRNVWWPVFFFLLCAFSDAVLELPVWKIETRSARCWPVDGRGVARLSRRTMSQEHGRQPDHGWGIAKIWPSSRLAYPIHGGGGGSEGPHWPRSAGCETNAATVRAETTSG